MTRIFYWTASALLAWLLMQAVHEFGHVLGAGATGGRVKNVVLHPFAVSRTDVEPNPSPHVELWAGPCIGVLVPLGLWFVAWRAKNPLAAWLRFFAGFCLIANGCYIGYGIIEPIGDAEELVRLGTPSSSLGIFGLICVVAGLRLWHGLGMEFGIGKEAKPVTARQAGIVSAVLLAIVVVELCLSDRI